MGEELIERILKSVAEVKPVLDPLNGATVLFAAEDMLVAASDLKRTRDLYPTFADPPLTVQLSTAIPPGRIVGMRRGEIVLMIGPEPKIAPPARPDSRDGARG
ncbi:hypothetical protein [uncultured Enterovirga sp.]|uniref:hypothetical protein n=1 Tax=uncultured Enterovirga sp. TaxID=2026352 RepID=UPI0035CC2A75